MVEDEARLEAIETLAMTALRAALLDELRLQGDFPRLAALCAEGRLPLDRLVTRTYPLRAINEAYADLLRGVLARGVLVFS